MRKALTTVVMTAILLLIVVVTSPAAAASNVCRDIPSGPQASGVDIPISLSVTVDGADWYMIDEVIPPGLTVTDADGADTTESGHLKWMVLSGASDTTYTYKVQGSAGTYTFSGEFQMEGMSDPGDIDCDTELVIEGEPSAEKNVCRGIPSGPQASGVDIPISLSVTVDGADWYMIDEVIPPGLTVTDADGADTTESGHLKWMVLSGASDTTYTYKVQGSAGTYTFSGEFQMEGMSDPGDIDCDTELEISDNTPPTATVIYPNGGEVLSGEVTLNASATDPDGYIVSVEFYCSDDAGSTWKYVGSGSPASDYYTYTGDTRYHENGDSYMIKAVATDDLGAVGEDTSDGVFTIDNGFCLHLEAGLNFVSIPKTIVDSPKNATTVFNVDYYSGEFCLYHNASAGSFDLDADVKPCRGFLVYKNEPMTVCVHFDDAAMAASQQLYEGWNTIGHIKTTEMPINDGTTADFASITGLEEPNGNELFRLMSTYTPGTGWTEYPAGSLVNATPGAGYWIYMKQDVMMSGGFE